MTSRRPRLVLIGCLAGLDVLAQSAVGFTRAPASQTPDVRLTTRLLAANDSITPSPTIAELTPASPGLAGVELQNTLQLWGYFKGNVTGIYRESATAVSQLQQAVKLQRSAIAQVPAASSQPATKPTPGLPLWLYTLAGILAVAAGVTWLRWSGRSRPLLPVNAVPTPPNQTASAQSVLATQPPVVPVAQLSDAAPSPSDFRGDQLSAIAPAGAALAPNLDSAAQSVAPTNQTQAAAPRDLASQPALVNNGHQSAPLLSATGQPRENSYQAATAPPALEAAAKAESAPAAQTAVAMTPLSETTRMAKINIVEELIQDLRLSDAVKRHKVIWELSHRGDTRAVQPLVDLLIDSDSKQRSLILSALSEIGTRTLRPMSRALAISLQDDSADVRKNAIRDLTRVYDMVAQISQLLHQATDDPDDEVQETARWALGQLNRIRSVPGTENVSALKHSVSPPENLP